MAERKKVLANLRETQKTLESKKEEIEQAKIKELEENYSDLSGDKISMVDKFIDNYKKQEIYESYCEMCNFNCVDIDNLYDF